jgi:hypothetical protein
MTLHPLISHELSLARRDHLRRESEAARSLRAPTGDNDYPAGVRRACADHRRHVRMTACAPSRDCLPS